MLKTARSKIRQLGVKKGLTQGFGWLWGIPGKYVNFPEWPLYFRVCVGHFGPYPLQKLSDDFTLKAMPEFFH